MIGEPGAPANSRVPKTLWLKQPSHTANNTLERSPPHGRQHAFCLPRSKARALKACAYHHEHCSLTIPHIPQHKPHVLLELLLDVCVRPIGAYLHAHPPRNCLTPSLVPSPEVRGLHGRTFARTPPT